MLAEGQQPLNPGWVLWMGSVDGFPVFPLLASGYVHDMFIIYNFILSAGLLPDVRINVLETYVFVCCILNTYRSIHEHVQAC